MGYFFTGYLFNALWQIPLVACAAWIIARLTRRLGPSVEYGTWVAALLLELSMPACRLDLERLRELWQSLSAPFSDGSAHGGVTVAIGGASTGSTGLLHLPPVLAWTMLAAYSSVTAWLAARFAIRLWTTYRILRTAQPYEPYAPGGLSHVWVSALAAYPDAPVPRLYTSGAISGPATAGIRRSSILLPESLLTDVSDSDLLAVFLHELAHVQRNDFSWNLLFEAVTLPIAFHPCVALTRGRLRQSRELICDHLAAQKQGADTYAHSLLRLARIVFAGRRAPHLYAVGIFDANLLERRIMSLTSGNIAVKTSRRLITLAACALIAVGTCGSAMALRVNIGLATPQAKEAPLQVGAGVMAEQALNKVVPVYPVDAKLNKDTLDGSVVLSAVIGKDGLVDDLKVLKSLRADYDKSALDAVREWKYKPYLLNGEPVAVSTTITVTYSLAY